MHSPGCVIAPEEDEELDPDPLLEALAPLEEDEPAPLDAPLLDVSVPPPSSPVEPELVVDVPPELEPSPSPADPSLDCPLWFSPLPPQATGVPNARAASTTEKVVEILRFMLTPFC